LNRESYIIESLKSDYIGDDGATMEILYIAWMVSMRVSILRESG